MATTISGINTNQLSDSLATLAQTFADTPPQLRGAVQGVARIADTLNARDAQLRNLLENAMRYGMTAGAHDDVVLSLSRQSGGPVLNVCDRGPGVPPPYRDRIFEPFFRLPGATERAGGVGLGLSLVKSIAERHGAQVRCTDREGGGACFELRGFLPR